MALDFMPYTEGFDDRRDIVRFMGWDSGRWVRCGVKREALLKAARVPPANGMDLIKLYRKHKAPIHARASAKFRSGRIEEDGLVLVDSADFGL
jgi:hypothetical protein